MPCASPLHAAATLAIVVALVRGLALVERLGYFVAVSGDLGVRRLPLLVLNRILLELLLHCVVALGIRTISRAGCRLHVLRLEKGAVPAVYAIDDRFRDDGSLVLVFSVQNVIYVQLDWPSCVFIEATAYFGRLCLCSRQLLLTLPVKRVVLDRFDRAKLTARARNVANDIVDHRVCVLLAIVFFRFGHFLSFASFCFVSGLQSL